MDLICLKNELFYQLVKEIIERLKDEEKTSLDIWVDGQTAMEILKIKKTKLYYLRSTGEIRYSQANKKNILYFKPSLIEYLEKNAKETF